ncbi:MAG TPA: hypothetical protein VMT86_19415 [Bryobacteraceae bacterium]|nr:hypothetical protein [Bryobacteraceae bacterium]
MKLCTKSLHASIVLALALWAPTGLLADATIRYHSEFKPSPVLQPFMEQLMKHAQAGGDVSVRMKGNQAYTTAGATVEIFDFAKNEVTLLDPVHKTMAVVPVSELSDKFAAAVPQSPAPTPAVQQTLAAIKPTIYTKMTGNTAEIQGVLAEEREITVDMEMPMPEGMNQSQSGMKLVVHIWTAKKEEVLRVPAIRELTGYNAWQRYMVNPVGMLEKMTGRLPGVASSMAPIFEEMFKSPSVILRTHIEFYMPLMAALSHRMSAQNGAAPAFDPNAPLMEMNQEADELSSAPVDASIFEVPKDYTAISADEMVRSMVQPQSTPAAAATQK